MLGALVGVSAGALVGVAMDGALVGGPAGASDVEGTDGGADVANIGDSAAQINLNFK